MKIVIINPNISHSVTDLIRAEAERAALPSTHFTMATAPFGVAYIETPGEAAIGAFAGLQMLAEHHAGHDAAIVAAFGDPGVPAAKELLPIPVVGLTEAAVASAFLLGGRFAIVGISQRIGAWYVQTVTQLGLASRLAGYRGLQRGFVDVGTVHRDAREALLKMCLRCVEEDGADSIILAGAPLAGLAREITDAVPVPLIDGVGSAVRMAEALARGGYAPRRAGSLAPPPTKAHQGLNNGLARLIGRAP